MLWAACFVQYLQRHIVSCSFIPPGGLPAMDGIEHCIAWHSIAQHNIGSTIANIQLILLQNLRSKRPIHRFVV